MRRALSTPDIPRHVHARARDVLASERGSDHFAPPPTSPALMERLTVYVGLNGEIARAAPRYAAWT